VFEQMFELGVDIGATDNITAPMSKMGNNLDWFRSNLQPLRIPANSATCSGKLGLILSRTIDSNPWPLITHRDLVARTSLLYRDSIRIHSGMDCEAMK
jgi:hypothetical protein